MKRKMQSKEKTMEHIKRTAKKLCGKMRARRIRYWRRPLRERLVWWIGKKKDQCCEWIAMWRERPTQTYLISLEQNCGYGFVELWKDGKCFQARTPEWAVRQARDEALIYADFKTGERFTHPRSFVYLRVRDTLWKVPDGQPYPGLTPYRVYPPAPQEEAQDAEEG